MLSKAQGPRRSKRCVQQMQGVREKFPPPPKDPACLKEGGRLSAASQACAAKNTGVAGQDKKLSLGSQGLPRRAVLPSLPWTQRPSDGPVPPSPAPRSRRGSGELPSSPNCWAPLASAPSYTQGISSIWHGGVSLGPDQPELPSGILGLTSPAVQAGLLGRLVRK